MFTILRCSLNLLMGTKTGVCSLALVLSPKRLHLNRRLCSKAMDGIEAGKQCAAFAAVDELVKVCQTVSLFCDDFLHVSSVSDNRAITASLLTYEVTLHY